MGSGRHTVIRGWLLCCTMSAQCASADPGAGTPDPEQAEEWNAAWEDLAAEPPDSSRTPPIPDITPSTRARAFSVRARSMLPDPDEASRWRRTGTLLRARATDGGAWDGGLVLERDSREPGYVDHLGWTVSWQPDRTAVQAVAGQYRVHAGTGLIVNRTTTSWMDFGAFRPRPASVTATLSTTESGELVGAATYARLGRISLLAAAAAPTWDATLDTSGVATRLREEGVHVTEGERAAKDRLRERFGFIHTGFEVLPGTAVGLSSAASAFASPTSLALDASDTRNRLTWAGGDIRHKSPHADVWGEVVRGSGGRTAGAGAARLRTREFTLLMAGWAYDADYVAPHSSSWSFRGETTDERAIAGGLRYTRGRVDATAFAASYRQGRASRSDPYPREGTREQLDVAYKAWRKVVFETRLRERRVRRPGLGSAEDETRREARVVARIPLGSVLLRPRIDVVRSQPTATGLLGAAYVRMDIGRWLVAGEVAGFRSTDSAAALYLYEYRAPSYGVVRALHGTGVAWNARMACDLNRSSLSIGVAGVSRRRAGTSLTVTAQVEATAL